MKQVSAQGVLRATADAGANIRTANGVTEIASNSIEGNTTAAVLVIPQIPDGELISGDYIVSRAEQRQITFIGMPTGVVASVVKEEVAASTATVPKVYQIAINDAETTEGGKKGTGYYSYTAPITLSGSAGTDRYNLFASLAAKVNAHAQNNASAYTVSVVAFTAGSDAVPVVGETITQATSLATAKIAGVKVGANDFDGDDATGLLYLYDITGTWSASSLVSTGGTSSALFTTAAALTAGEGMVIVDDAGYFPAGPSDRQGANVVSCTKGFTVYSPSAGESDDLEIDSSTYPTHVNGLIGLDQRGIGTRMVEDIPVFTRDGSDVVQGLAAQEMWNGVDPVAGKLYTQVNFHIRKQTHKANAGHIGGEGADQTYVAWVDETSSYVAAFLAQLATNTGVTFRNIS